MKRTFLYLSTLVGLGGVIYLAGTTRAQAPPPAAAPAVRPTIAVFNMAAVMRDYGKAKYQVYQLNQKRVGMSGDLIAWRNEYIAKQQEAQRASNPAVKEELTKRLVELARKVEDKDREISKALNEDASAIISQLYEDIKTVVDKTAEMNGYHIVFAYPDAVTPEDLKSAAIRELKLKPPAAQPFYIAGHVNITGLVVETLNKWYPAPQVPAEVPPAPGANGGAPPTPTPLPAPPK